MNSFAIQTFHSNKPKKKPITSCHDESESSRVPPPAHLAQAFNKSKKFAFFLSDLFLRPLRTVFRRQ